MSHKRTYLVQVKNIVNAETLEKLRTGISIRVKGGEYYSSKPSDISISEKPPGLFLSGHETFSYKEHTWMVITLTEGKFHQVRKMVAAAGHRCKRLIRLSIEDLELGELQPGGVKELKEDEFFSLLKIKTR
jgi:23S rRNA pseudouridine2457 synthase